LVGFYAGLGDELGLYVRQIAWLSAAPETKHKGKGPPPEPVTRIKTMQKRGEAPTLPPNPAPYLVDWLFEIGPGGGMEGPLCIRHIAADLEALGIEVMPWEATVLRHLSRQYLNESHEARKQDRPPPYSGAKDEIEERRAIVDRKLSAAFAGLVRKKG